MQKKKKIGKLSLKEATNRQNELFTLIFKMKKKISKKLSKGRHFSDSNKKDNGKLDEIANTFYSIRSIRNQVINVFEKGFVEPDFEWIKNTDAFKEVLNRIDEILE